MRACGFSGFENSGHEGLEAWATDQGRELDAYSTPIRHPKPNSPVTPGNPGNQPIVPTKLYCFIVYIGVITGVAGVTGKTSHYRSETGRPGSF